MSWPGGLAVAVAAMSVAAAAAVGGTATARAAGTGTPAVLTSHAGTGERGGLAATSFSVAGLLSGVAATSARSAWAVGNTPYLQTLIVHWNGVKWAPVTNPKPVRGLLSAVTAAPHGNAWAVGSTLSGSGYQTLIMHWNGKSWSRSGPAIPGMLFAVAASGSTVWAVGQSETGLMILHRVGADWYVLAAPNPAPESGDYLAAVAATGKSAAWAAGTGAFLLRWNGAYWTTASSPLRGASTGLDGMAAGPDGAVWAVGNGRAGTGKDVPVLPLSMRWNGRKWQKVAVPGARDNSELDGVTFIPGGTAWAVGWISAPSPAGATALVLHWTGTKWAREPSSEPGTYGGQLSAVAAVAADDAWAVGSANTSSGLETDTLILHWNGKTWS